MYAITGVLQTIKKGDALISIGGGYLDKPEDDNEITQKHIGEIVGIAREFDTEK